MLSHTSAAHALGWESLELRRAYTEENIRTKPVFQKCMRNARSAQALFAVSKTGVPILHKKLRVESAEQILITESPQRSNSCLGKRIMQDTRSYKLSSGILELYKCTVRRHLSGRRRIQQCINSFMLGKHEAQCWVVVTLAYYCSNQIRYQPS